jgi:hypothetical protein
VRTGRREGAGGLGQAVAVRPKAGDTAAFSGARDATTTTPATPSLDVPGSGARLSFDLFLDTGETDLLVLERSAGGGQVHLGDDCGAACNERGRVPAVARLAPAQLPRRRKAGAQQVPDDGVVDLDDDRQPRHTVAA